MYNKTSNLQCSNGFCMLSRINPDITHISSNWVYWENIHCTLLLVKCGWLLGKLTNSLNYAYANPYIFHQMPLRSGPEQSAISSLLWNRRGRMLRNDGKVGLVVEWWRWGEFTPEGRIRLHRVGGVGFGDVVEGIILVATDAAAVDRGERNLVVSGITANTLFVWRDFGGRFAQISRCPRMRRRHLADKVIIGRCWNVADRSRRRIIRFGWWRRGRFCADWVLTPNGVGRNVFTGRVICH